MDKIKTELLEILLALVKGLKVLVIYIIPSILLAILFIPDIGTIIQQKPEIILPYIINAIVSALITYFRPKVDPNTESELTKIKG